MTAIRLLTDNAEAITFLTDVGNSSVVIINFARYSWLVMAVTPIVRYRANQPHSAVRSITTLTTPVSILTALIDNNDNSQ